MNITRRARPSDPLLTTRWLDITSAATWGAQGLWGVATLLVPLRTFGFVGAPGWYQLAWSLGIACASFAASAGSLGIFFNDAVGVLFKKRLERDGLWLLVALLWLYELLLVPAVLAGHLDRFPQILLVLTLLPFPLFRISHLNRRITTLLKPARP